MQRRPRRLHAPLRRGTQLLRRQRDRRRRAATRGGARAGRQDGRRSRVVACFFGEGAMAEGEFHESMNLAALWRLPVLFCCENNLYAMGTALERSESETDLAPEGGRLRDAGVAGRRHGRARRRGRRPPRGADRARRRAVLPRAADLPLPGPLDVRPRPLPQQGGDRSLAPARPARAVRGRAARGARCSTTPSSSASSRRSPPRSTMPSRSPRRPSSSRSRTSSASCTPSRRRPR